MAPSIIASLLVVVAFVAAEGRVDHPILAPLNGSSPLNASFADGRKLTGEDECAWTCDHVRYKMMCHAIAKLPGVSTPRSLLEAAVRVSLSKAKMIRGRFAEAAAAEHEGNPMASILKSCVGNYNDLVGELEEVQRSIEAHDSHTNLVNKMSAASTYATDCDNWFEERELASPYQRVQNHVARVVSNALGIAALVKQV